MKVAQSLILMQTASTMKSISALMKKELPSITDAQFLILTKMVLMMKKISVRMRQV
jgi:hypothetical protein